MLPLPRLVDSNRTSDRKQNVKNVIRAPGQGNTPSVEQKLRGQLALIVVGQRECPDDRRRGFTQRLIQFQAIAGKLRIVRARIKVDENESDQGRVAGVPNANFTLY